VKPAFPTPENFTAYRNYAFFLPLGALSPLEWYLISTNKRKSFISKMASEVNDSKGFGREDYKIRQVLFFRNFHNSLVINAFIYTF